MNNDKDSFSSSSNTQKNERYYDAPYVAAPRRYANGEDPWAVPTGRRRSNRVFNVFMAAMLMVLAVICLGGSYLLVRLNVHVVDTGDGYRFGQGEAVLETPDIPPVSSATPVPKPPRGSGGGDARVLIADTPAPTPATDFSSLRVLTVNEIYQRVAPCVVGIVAESSLSAYPSSGSGIVMREDGYIITNNHVVESADVITVVLETGEELSATLIGCDAQTDLAVIKADISGLRAVEFGNSDNARPGDLAVTIGNPVGLSLQNTVTAGIISAIDRGMVVGNHQMTLLQIDASVNPGNSGGPLINEYGQVIGIISSKLMSAYSSYYMLEGLGFAIPITIAAPILDELIAHGYVKGRPTIGITNATEIDEQSARYFDYPLGIMVRNLHPDCDAAAQGLAVGDIIVEVNGVPVTTIAEVNAVKAETGVGGSMTVKVFREGDYLEITFILADEGELGES